MARLLAHPFWSDARHYQIAALATLLTYNLGWLDSGRGRQGRGKL